MGGGYGACIYRIADPNRVLTVQLAQRYPIASRVPNHSSDPECARGYAYTQIQSQRPHPNLKPNPNPYALTLTTLVIPTLPLPLTLRRRAHT